jgi:hypothetical protein
MSVPYPTNHIEEWLRPATEPGLPYSNVVAYVPTTWQRRVWSALFEFAGAQSNVYLSDYYQRDGSIRVQIPPRQTRQIARIENLLCAAGIQFSALELCRTSWAGTRYELGAA